MKDQGQTLKHLKSNVSQTVRDKEKVACLFPANHATTSLTRMKPTNLRHHVSFCVKVFFSDGNIFEIGWPVPEILAGN